MNSWANCKSSFHKHFRYIAQVPYSLLLSFLFLSRSFFFFFRQPNIAMSFVLSEMEVSDSGDVKGSTPHQTLLGSCCQRVWQRLWITFCLFSAQLLLYPFETMPISQFHLGFWLRLRHAHFGFWPELLLSVCRFYGYGSFWLIVK